MSSGGSIRLRKDGRWEGRYRQDGRQRSVFGKTRRDAQERLRAGLMAADNGIRPVAQRQTVAAYLDEWVTGLQRRPRTVDSYRDTVRLYITPTIGRIPLAKLEPADVARMVATLARGDLSATTVHYAYAVLRAALGRALKSGRVHRNVAKMIDAPTKARPEMRPLTAAEAREFLESVADHRFGPLYTLAVATGMRQGELLGLRWEDVDLDKGVVAVKHTLRRGKDRELADPKTDRARRALRLGASAVAALREQRRRQLSERLASGRKWQDLDFVFATSQGTAFDAGIVTRSLQVALARAGLPRQRFHDLRHAYATLMLEAGEDLAVVSKSLGHSNLATTADVYAHLTPTMLERSASRMDDILTGRATG